MLEKKENKKSVPKADENKKNVLKTKTSKEIPKAKEISKAKESKEIPKAKENNKEIPKEKEKSKEIPKEKENNKEIPKEKENKEIPETEEKKGLPEEKETEKGVKFYTPNTLHEYKAIYCTDVIEFCPYKGNENLYVIGTYEVLESGGNVISEAANDLPDDVNDNDNNIDNDDDDTDIDIEDISSSSSESIKRTGRLLLQSMEPKADKSKIKVDNVETINTPAIFDLKWSYQKINYTGYLGMADAVGNVTIYELSSSELEYNLKKVVSTENTTYELCCSLDWANRITNIPKIVVSRSNGYISLYEFGDNDLKQLNHWKAHSLEAWVASFDQWNPNVLYTGADDCLFKGFDTRIGTSTAIFTNKQHDAGVCSIQVNPNDETILATGSYDTYLNIWDKRNLKKPLIHYCTDGGVWKVKWHPEPEMKYYIGAACMYNGFHIYNIDLNSVESNEGITEICSYTKHESIAYGIDWCRYRNSILNKQIVGTCSFYDHLFHLWEMEEV